MITRDIEVEHEPEGRIKDAHFPRPKLSTLNSASSVKKWIPSIKSEIEYYLQQSQLTHYPERKIAEFHLCIKALENEYKRFITKLRALDPTCKHQPWTPRAYSRRRADPRDSPSTAIKKQHCGWLEDNGGSVSGVERGLASKNESNKSLSNEREEHISQPEAKSNPILEHSAAVSVGQDLPLSFNPTRLAVAVAGFRGPVTQSDASPSTQNLTRALHCGLPNLSSCLLGQSLRTPETSSDSGAKAERTGHVLLGLSCYSSSDEEPDT